MSIQKINVKNTYVATVKSDVANRALSFYIKENEKNDIFVENSIFPSVDIKVNEPVNDVNLNGVINSTDTTINDNTVNTEVEIPEELNIDKNISVPIVSEENSNTNPTLENVEIDNNVSMVNPSIEIPNLNVLESQPIDNNVSPSPMPMPNIPEANIHPEPIPNPVEEKPVSPIPVNDNFANVDMMVNAPVNNNLDNKPPMFNASGETNLLGALAENQGHSSIGNINVTPENLNVVREFGVDEPVVTNQKNVATGGFINSKIFLIVVIAFFLASCVFLGYEMYQYINR